MIFKNNKFLLLSIFAFLMTTPTIAQHHDGNWIYKNANDTTFVHCWSDTLTMSAFPAGSMMGMMGMPDSIYCRIDRMYLDSLHHPHDSTFIGWYRMQIGRDSLHFNMMNDDSGMMSGNHMIQFSMGTRCRLHWDSLMTDSMHRNWKPTGILAWDGSQWISIPISLSGNDAEFIASQLYSVYGIVGEVTTPLEVKDDSRIVNSFILSQNFPNPFNPSTEIRFTIPLSGIVRLRVYNILGNEVTALINDEMMAKGEHTIRFDGENLSSGIYFYTLQSGNFKESRKMLLIR
jgi:hypothetical protein